MSKVLFIPSDFEPETPEELALMDDLKKNQSFRILWEDRKIIERMARCKLTFQVPVND